MAAREHETEAVRVYRRTLDEVAAQQVIAAAEDVIADGWIDELERMRGAAIESAAAMLQQNRAELDHAEAERVRVDLDRVRALVDAVDAEVECACRAALDRTRRGRADLARLRTAWTAAYGD